MRMDRTRSHSVFMSVSESGSQRMSCSIHLSGFEMVMRARREGQGGKFLGVSGGLSTSLRVRGRRQSMYRECEVKSGDADWMRPPGDSLPVSEPRHQSRRVRSNDTLAPNLSQTNPVPSVANNIAPTLASWNTQLLRLYNSPGDAEHSERYESSRYCSFTYGACRSKNLPPCGPVEGIRARQRNHCTDP